MEQILENRNINDLKNVKKLSSSQLQTIEKEIDRVSYDNLILLKNLSLLTLENDSRKETSLYLIQKLLDKSDERARTILLEDFISFVKNNLLFIKQRHHTTREENIGLNPKLGISLEDDQLRDTWRANGGIYVIPMFFTAIHFMERQNISSNINWIVPGILNILDDTSDILNIKLKGVSLLNELLCITSTNVKDSFLSFDQLGLFELFEPILSNMFYYLPPSYDSKIVLKIWNQLFPTIILLYKTKPDHDCHQVLCKFISEIILQNILPRISLDHEELTMFVLDQLINLIKFIQNDTLVILQRLIFVIGEYLVKNPFITTFNAVLIKTLKLISTMLDYTPIERIKAHRYDFLGLIVIVFEKATLEIDNEEHTDSNSNEIVRMLQQLLVKLQDSGCDFTQDKVKLIQSRSHFAQLFNSTI
ncbi:hypothetical protein TBLA_0A08370 [Henningerozyma blattae CBS 6284]|uniref:Uncharacterized protein n=1 Tax=Henningerozyma blattae (strain ATCC 34711 / CBS 6284 / DSM 70876 / NBRC 10599 / NRRL Y-10934 / UCD 77-7) TaxID=1071380 RepID=I2GWX4_HENB6|nr:hypothetical protein TBLA_0A08370 [Tetrapisispora blattae CBS 6284]CCH58626.1 hypothetical protein TBLA_0A08370 [Tetrapisispora blattae CBS 6284]